MNFDFLFNKNDRICIQIFRLLNTQTTHTIPVDVLKNQFDLTSYQVNKFYDSMNADLAAVTIAGAPPCYIETEIKGIWHIHHFDTYTLHRLAVSYYTRSTPLKIMAYKFFYSELQTSVAYSKQNFISTSAFFHGTQALNKELTQQGFYQTTNAQYSLEFTIRTHLFQFYYANFTGSKICFPELTATADQLIAACQPLITTTLVPTQRAKLAIFFKILILRLNNQQPLTDFAINPQLYQGHATAFAQPLQAILPALTAAEIDYIYCFLITQDFIQLQTDLITTCFPEVTTLTQYFMMLVTTQEILLPNINLDQTGLYAAILRINMQIVALYIEPTTFIDADQIQFFEELYPAYDTIIRQYLRYLRRYNKQTLSDSMTINLYFSYMFALINEIPIDNLNEQVFICVDFSQGTLYSNYVIQSLTAFKHAHIVVERDICDHTDLYISDFHADTVKQPQVIWQDPPTPTDWSKLSDLILALKQQKVATRPPIQPR